MEEIIERSRLNSFELDGIINRVAGEICNLLTHNLDSYGDCFFLISAISLEVSKPLREANRYSSSLWDQRDKISWKINAGVRKVLKSYDIDDAFLDKLGRDIGHYVLSSLEEAFKDEPKLASLN